MPAAWKETRCKRLGFGRGAAHDNHLITYPTIRKNGSNVSHYLGNWESRYLFYTWKRWTNSVDFQLLWWIMSSGDTPRRVTVRKSVSLGLTILILCDVLWAGLGSDKTMYVGGTVTSIKQGMEGKSSTNDEKVFVFAYKGGQLKIPYERVNDLEYGQKAGRRLGVAIMVTPLALFSKKRKHYLTVGYQDENDKQQAVVFELGKDIVRVTLASLEARTGRKIEYQDEEARKSGKGN